MGIFGKKHATADPAMEVAQAASPREAPAQPVEPIALDTYKVTYKGGHPDLPKAKIGEIRLLITPEAFVLNPTLGSKKFWHALTIPYINISSVQIVTRQVSTGEALLGGLDSRQLNQNNNIHIEYTDAGGSTTLLRFEMLTGVTVMGQANKCRQFEDRLRTLGITAKFEHAATDAPSAPPADDIPTQISKLAQLRDQGILTEDEFQAKKTDLLARL